MFNRITIKKYRHVEDVTLDDLRRVNLIVGTNGTGKTSILEAAVLLAGQNLFDTLAHYNLHVEAFLPIDIEGKSGAQSSTFKRYSSDSSPWGKSLSYYKMVYQPEEVHLGLLSNREEEDLITFVHDHTNPRFGDFSEREIALGGQGTHQTLAVVSEITQCPDGVLSIDNVDTGLHPKSLPAYAKLLNRMAAQFNVQLFLTTHNADAVRSFSTLENDVSAYALTRNSIKHVAGPDLKQFIDGAGLDLLHL